MMGFREPLAVALIGTGNRAQTVYEPLFPALTDDAILQPTLHWRLFANAAAKVDAELSYVTAGMSWQASYNLIAPEQGDVMDIVGWITIDNQSGKVFPEATIKLMAGDVNKIQPEGGPIDSSSMFLGAMSRAAAPAVTEKAFDELKSASYAGISKLSTPALTAEKACEVFRKRLT